MILIKPKFTLQIALYHVSMSKRNAFRLSGRSSSRSHCLPEGIVKVSGVCWKSVDNDDDVPVPRRSYL